MRLCDSTAPYYYNILVQYNDILMNIFLFVFSRAVIMQLSIWTVATNVTSTTDTPEVNKTTNKFTVDINTFLYI